MSTVNSDIFLLSHMPSVFAYSIVGKYSTLLANRENVLCPEVQVLTLTALALQFLQ